MFAILFDSTEYCAGRKWNYSIQFPVPLCALRELAVRKEKHRRQIIDCFLSNFMEHSAKAASVK